MLVLSGDLLVSDCCEELIFLDEQGEYVCSKCQTMCGSAGTLKDKRDRQEEAHNE